MRLSFHQTIGSTNEEALQLAEEGAPHGTLIVADAQTAGRGRSGRSWITLPGTSLAFSLILRLPDIQGEHWLRMFGMSAMSIANALDHFGLAAQIKWPNDVLLEGKKVAGILISNTWDGEVIEYSIIGIGVNVTQESIPQDVALDFPAISIEGALGRAVDRVELLTAILHQLAMQYGRMDTQEFLEEWRNKLAYLNQQVQVKLVDGEIAGKLLGLTPKGELTLLGPDNRVLTVGIGDMTLRPSIKSGSDQIEK